MKDSYYLIEGEKINDPWSLFRLKVYFYGFELPQDWIIKGKAAYIDGFDISFYTPPPHNEMSIASGNLLNI